MDTTIRGKAEEALEALQFLGVDCYIEIERNNPSGGGYINHDEHGFHAFIRRAPNRAYVEILGGSNECWDTLADAILAYKREEEWLAKSGVRAALMAVK